ncbi:hypothetical protein NAT47_07075 [Flavobacterium sp. HXWNR69]|uniref:DUF3108 domain-containing protein n=1 Tax=Flavobacterium fragile TaxID=2949085 RepID=A0ABT0TGS5_9FLAO|nr:hypothetical protein [Flavobacterium sp. HXWNR69]MCL9770174.1 hypothetical protein [Flavobacterium sp. HXWNR69]
MKYLIKLIIFLISLNLNAQIEGKFKHKICKHGPNCFVFKFDKNGTFEFIYNQDILGSGSLTGKYTVVKDTIKLTTDKVFFSQPTRIIETENSDSKTTKIAVKIQRASKKGEEETESMECYISINDGDFFKTDHNGMLIIPKMKINKIQIKDIFEIELKSEPLIKLTETIFYPKFDKNSIEIFTSENDEGIDLAMSSWMTKLLLIKGKKLFPLTFEPEEVYLGKEKTYYEKFN